MQLAVVAASPRLLGAGTRAAAARKVRKMVKPAKPNALQTLLTSGLHVSAEEGGGSLDAKALVRLVDRRWNSLRDESLQRARLSAEEWQSALSDRRKQSLASIAVLAERFPLQGPPGLGAFTLKAGDAPKLLTNSASLETLKEAAGAQLRRMRRSASNSRLGQTLARTMSGRDLLAAGGSLPSLPSEWDLFKSLDSNLRSLERSFREGAGKRASKPRRRAKPAPGGDEVRRSLASPGTA